MPTLPSDKFSAPPAPRVAVWRWLVWMSFTVLLFNAWAVGWHSWTGVLAYEVPSRAAIAHGHLWTLFTYVLAGAGAYNVTPWVMSVVGIIFLFAVARLTEAEIPHWNFLSLCAACALGGSAAWLPLHWADGTSLVTGCSVLVLGLLSFWCFTVPDEAMPVQFFWVKEVRPPLFFWLALALETGAFLSFELPTVLGHPWVFHGKAIHGGFDNSAHLGGMLAGWAVARVWRRRSVGEVFSFPAEIAPTKVAAVSVGAKRPTPAATGAGQSPILSQRELRAEVDRILDKINHDGIASLNVQERQTLGRARQLLKK